MKKCVVCGKEFTDVTYNKSKKSCSPECKTIRNKQTSLDFFYRNHHKYRKYKVNEKIPLGVPYQNTDWLDKANCFGAEISNGFAIKYCYNCGVLTECYFEGVSAWEKARCNYDIAGTYGGQSCFDSRLYKKVKNMTKPEVRYWLRRKIESLNAESGS